MHKVIFQTAPPLSGQFANDNKDLVLAVATQAAQSMSKAKQKIYLFWLPL